MINADSSPSLSALCSLSSSYRSQTLISSPAMWLAGVHRKRESFARSRNGSTLLAIGRDRCSIGRASLSRIDTGVPGGCVVFPGEAPPRCKTCDCFVWRFLRLIDDEQVRGWSLDATFFPSALDHKWPQLSQLLQRHPLPPPRTHTHPVLSWATTRRPTGISITRLPKITEASQLQHSR